MKLYGVAIAITGKEPEVKLTCTTTAIDSEHRDHVEKIDDHSFEMPINLHDQNQLREALIKTADAIGEAFRRQTLNFHLANKPYRPFSLVIGEDGRQNYDINDTIRLLFTPDKQKVRSRKLEHTYNKLSEAIPYAALKIGRYGRWDGRKEPPPEQNEVLLGMSRRFGGTLLELKKGLDEGDAAALSELKDWAKITAEMLAGEMTRVRGAELARNETFFPEDVPIKNFHLDMDAQKEHPLFCFLGWDERIRKCYEDTLIKELGITGNITAKLATEAPASPFCDVTRAMTLNQIDVMEGKRTEQDISYMDNAAWRAKLSYALKRAMAAPKVVSEQTR